MIDRSETVCYIKDAVMPGLTHNHKRRQEYEHHQSRTRIY